MKIIRFNENFTMNVEYNNKNIIRSTKLSDDVNSFILTFNRNIDYGIIDWIRMSSNKTKLTEYKYLGNEQSFINFGKNKKLNSVEQYGEVESEYSDMINQIRILQKKLEKYVKRKEKLYTETSSQLLYKFQEDLYLTDFNNLYNIFILDSIDNDDPLLNIHPDIITKYGDSIIENILPIISSKKINI